MKNEEVACDKCDYVGKSPTGLQIHQFRKHTKRGQELAKAAAIRMNSPANRKKSLATRARRMLTKKAGVQVELPVVSKPRRKAWSTNRKKASLQHAANRMQLNYCPNCACNLEAVSVALSFAAGAR